jgi:hypothetical protein
MIRYHIVIAYSLEVATKYIFSMTCSASYPHNLSGCVQVLEYVFSNRHVRMRNMALSWTGTPFPVFAYF